MRKILSRLGVSTFLCIAVVSGAPEAWSAGGEVPPGSPTGESPYAGPANPEPVRIERRRVRPPARVHANRERRAREAEARLERRREDAARAAEEKREAARIAAARVANLRAQLARGIPPAASETRLRASEILVVTRPSLTQAAIDALLARHRLTGIETAPTALTGETWRLWRAGDNRSVRALVRELAREDAVLRVQPNFIYMLAQAASAGALPQYALAHLHTEGLADSGDGVRVAVIDAMVDARHPDLQSAIEAVFDAIGGEAAPHKHGTAVAGAIAANGAVKGAAPRAKLLTARAFGADAQGTTLAVLKGLDWAAGQKARVVNMSFAGPPDPALARAVQAALARNILLVAAAGNAGPKSQPLYPAADPGVIAVAASDTADGLYAASVRGPHVRLAAPGVDVLLPSVEGKYDLETGTSVAAGFVSGVAALIAQRDTKMAPAALSKLLLQTMRPAATAHAVAGIGLVDARRALDEREKAGASR